MDTSASTFILLLKKNGREQKRVTGSHHIFFNRVLKKTIPVPVHKKDLGIGLRHALFKQAELILQKPKK